MPAWGTQMFAFQVKLAVMVQLLRVCRWLWVTLTLLFFVLFLVSKTAADVWLSEWANDAERFANDTLEAARKQSHFRLAVFGGIGVAQGEILWLVIRFSLIHYNICRDISVEFDRIW